MRLQPIFTLQAYNQTNNECLLKFVLMNNSFLIKRQPFCQKHSIKAFKVAGLYIRREFKSAIMFCLHHALFTPWGVNYAQLLRISEPIKLLETPRPVSVYTPIISVLICLDEEVCSVTDMNRRAPFSFDWLPTNQLLVFSLLS